ncbi:MAG: hypothetical protein NC548_49975 [Lachnospiraceae bacterium]|nr:hypothetical protein [Lachnospiraceae bacterium]
MLEELENKFVGKIDTIRDKINVLHFSTGADSVASFLKLRENGINPILVYKYFIKDLPMVGNYIDYFEKKFDVKIYQMPSTLYMEAVGSNFWGIPHKNYEEKLNKNMDLSRAFLGYTKDFIDEEIDEKLGKGRCVFHLGLRYTDGIRRYQHLMKHGVQFKNKFYPIASYKVGDIKDLLNKYDCKLPIEYDLWGISLEGPRSWNLPLIKRHCPESYRMIVERFPFAPSMMLRENFNKLNRHFKSRVTQFKGFAMDKNLYEVW